MKRFRLLIVLMLTTVLFSPVAGNVFDQPMRFERFTVYDGISSNSIRQIVHDDYGFLWIATSNGLSRYNGYGFDIIRSGNDDRRLTDSDVHSIFCQGNYLWVGTAQTIERLDLQTNRFKVYLQGVDQVSTNCIAQTSDGTVWFGTFGNGIFRYNQQTDQLEPVALPAVQNVTVFSLRSAPSGKLWIGTEKHGVFYYDQRHSMIKKLLIPQDKENAILQRITSIYESDSMLYIACHGNGMYAYDLATRELEPVRPVNHRASNLQFSDIVPDHEGNLLIAGDQSGLLVYNPKRNRVAMYQHNPFDASSLSGNAVKCLFFDFEQTLWIGTDNKGLNRTTFYSGKGFHFISPVDYQGFSTGIQFNKLFVRNDGSAWLGSNGQGLFFLRSDGTSTMKVEMPSMFDRAAFLALYNDQRENLYFSVYPRQFYKAKIVIKPWSVALHNIIPLGLPEADIRMMEPGPAGSFWLGTDGQGLILWNEAKGIVRQFEKSWPASNNALPGNYISSIHRGNSPYLWVATNEGFARINELTYEIDAFSSINISSLSDFKIRAILEDHAGRLWLGTRKGILSSPVNVVSIDSLLRADGKVSWDFKVLGPEHQSNNDVINGLIEDRNGVVWASSEDGLIMVDLKNGMIERLDKNDGIGGNLFSPGGLALKPDNILLFAGDHGITYFQPESIRINKNPPRLVLEKLLVKGKEVEPGLVFNGRVLLEKQIDVPQSIVLKHKENSISIVFSVLSFINPQKNSLQYKLDGFDSDWVATTPHNRMASYSNLLPGKYTFHIRGSNNDGLWSERSPALEITVRSPFWASWWFLTIIMLLIFAAVQLIIYLREMQQRSVQKELEKQVAERTIEIQDQNKKLENKTDELKKANQVKDLFFNIIAHDLINPVASSHQLMGLIVKNLETMSPPDQQRLLNAAYKSTGQTLDLLMNLLMWARSQSKTIVYKFTDVNLHQLVNEVVGHVRSNARLKEIEIQNRIGTETVCHIDENTMQTVFRNLLSNAIKFSLPGSIVVVGEKIGKDGRIFFVSDQGTGIPVDVLPKLFEAESSHTTKGTQGEKGTGLGLKICRDFIDGNGGRIWAESTPGKGTTIFFTLPGPKRD